MILSNTYQKDFEQHGCKYGVPDMRQTGRLLLGEGGGGIQNQIRWNDFVSVINTQLETPKTLRDIITLRPAKDT